MSDQIVLALLCVVGFVVLMLVLGAMGRGSGAPSPSTPNEHRPERRPSVRADQRYCIFCRGPLTWDGTDWQMHPNCTSFGRCSECGYELMTSSRQDIFTHFCPPRLAAEKLAVEREMDRQRREQS